MTNQEINMEYFYFSGLVPTLKMTTATTKERPNLLVEVKAKTRSPGAAPSTYDIAGKLQRTHPLWEVKK